MEEILINEKTRQMLLDLDRQVVIAQIRANDICQVLINQNNSEGSKDKWELSEDKTRLTKIPTDGGKK